MIQAKVITDSICPRNHRLTTLEVVMPRYILAEFNTHRVKTRNSASSRAIPLKKMILNVMNNTFIPYAWQEDHKGMQGNKYLNDEYKFSLLEFVDKAKEFFKSDNEQDDKELKILYERILYQYKGLSFTLKEWWLLARDKALEIVAIFGIFGLTKQLANRLLEPFMYHKVLVSATEWENFFNLRCPQYYFKPDDISFKSRKEWMKSFNSLFDDRDDWDKSRDNLWWLQQNKGQADIHMMFLAEAIYDALNESTPRKLKEGEWHIPYGDNIDEEWIKKTNYVLPANLEGETYLKAITEVKCRISIARCARLSYQTLGDNPEINYEKDLELYDTLFKSGHFSPFEHVAKVMTEDEYNNFYHSVHEYDFEENYYKGSKKDLGWCLNYRGFIQQRYLLQNK